MSRSLVSILAFSIAAAPLAARAQDSAKEGAAPGDQPQAAPAAAPTQGEQEQRFQIRRGFFAESDLGIYLTFGGRNTNDPTLPKRVTSNLEPQLGLNLGYDVAHSESYAFALGVKLGMGFSGGSARATDAELAAELDVTTKANDFSVAQFGLLASLAIMMTDRLALTIRGDGGMGLLSPDPTQISKLDASDPGCAGGTPIEGGDKCVPADAGSSKFAPVFGGGLGIEYYTLLNDFSIGLLARFQAVLASGMIPGMTITVPIKYTF